MPKSTRAPVRKTTISRTIKRAPAPVKQTAKRTPVRKPGVMIAPVRKQTSIVAPARTAESGVKMQRAPAQQVFNQTRDAIADIWGPRTPHYAAWPERVDERTIAEPDRWVQSACVLCSNGCALDIGVKDGKIVGVRGRGVDRVNHGRLGPKGLYGWQANNSPDRLTRPLIKRGGKFQEASWDEAMDLIVSKTKEIMNGREVHEGEGVFCRGCSGRAYYHPVNSEQWAVNCVR